MSYARKIPALTLAALVAFTLAGAAFAVESTPIRDARDASNRIDRDLQATADRFNRELSQSQNQFQEARRLNTSPATPNRYGAQNQIDQEIAQTVDQANAELWRAKARDDYTERRRELETTQGLYYPGTHEYNNFTDQINRLDREFADRELSYRK